MSLSEEWGKKTDLVRPGEQWFCYWKTSAALWEGRILELSPNEIIFIPVFWGFHMESDGIWDFGRYHPERDLLRLIKILTQHGRRFCWLVPLTPAPFMPNGGMPSQTARTLSVSDLGMHFACLDQDETLHKMYSFYSPKVLSSYSSFLSNFAQLLSETHCQSPVWGVEFGYLQKGRFRSFLSDSSLAFEQGFSRYLKKKYPQGVELNQANLETKAKILFEQEVAELFSSVAKDSLSPFWIDSQKIIVFGSSPAETLERSLKSGKVQSQYFEDILQNYVANRWFSTCLMTKSEKKELLQKCLDEHFAPELEKFYRFTVSKGALTEDFCPLKLIEVIDNSDPEIFVDNGLKSHLRDHLPGAYSLNEKLNFSAEWIDHTQSRVKFFHAQNMNRTLFAQMLKLFLMGQKVVFDCHGLSEELDKRLEVFYLENNLKVQVVNFVTTIHFSEIGEGQLVIFDGKKLRENEKKELFWDHLFKFLDLSQVNISAPKDVYSFWRIRATSANELGYLDVRRLSLYNPTSYKKTVTIFTQKKFALMKVIDPSNAKARGSSDSVEVELLPNGNLSLDFGHYLEKL